MPRVETEDDLERAGRIRFQNGSMAFWLPAGLTAADIEVRLVKKKGPLPCK
jgi:hypothetical protein